MSKIIKSSAVIVEEQKQRVIHLKARVLPDDATPEQEIDSMPLIREEAKSIIINAQVEADNILKQAFEQYDGLQQRINTEKEKWEQEKQSFIAAAKKIGYEEGILLGRNNGYSEYLSLIETANNIINSAKVDYQQQIDSADQTILKLAIKVAEKIIGKHLNQNEGDFLLIVKKAIKEVHEHSPVTIHIHPTFYELVVANKAEILSILPWEKDLYVFPSEDLDRNACIIESSFGKIDASVDSQLIELKNKLVALLVEE